jgi:hypothetical protein
VKTITVINSVQYALALEYGWSTQAPYGMVRATLGMVAAQLPQAMLDQLKAMWTNNGVPDWSHWRASKKGPRFD